MEISQANPAASAAASTTPAEKHSRTIAPPDSERLPAKPAAMPSVRFVSVETSANTAHRAISPPSSVALPTNPHARVPPASRPSTVQPTMRMHAPLTVWARP